MPDRHDMYDMQASTNLSVHPGPRMRASLFALVMASLSVIVGGCDRVVDITVPDAPALLVVEGRVELVQGNVNGRQEIVLTTSAPYFRNEPAPAARGAQVVLRDDAGQQAVLQESATQPGHYITDSFTGTVGMRYTLRIQWQGDVYEATDSLLAVPPIDSLYFQPRNNGGFGPGSGGSSAGLRATIDMRDPVGVVNYYLWDMYVNGTRIVASDTAVPFRSIDSDQLYDGLRVRAMQPHGYTPVVAGQMVRVRQQSLSAMQYRYYRALNDQIEGDGSPFSVPPNSVRGNLANLTRPEVKALGYFMATQVSERSMRVP